MLAQQAGARTFMRRLAVHEDGADALGRADRVSWVAVSFTFPRVLGHHVREVRLFSLENAIHKMTGMTAARFGLADRGVLREGNAADLVLFDAEKMRDTATYENPISAAEGISAVFVNGKPAHGGARAGRLLAQEYRKGIPRKMGFGPDRLTPKAARKLIFARPDRRRHGAGQRRLFHRGDPRYRAERARGPRLLLGCNITASMCRAGKVDGKAVP